MSKLLKLCLVLILLMVAIPAYAEESSQSAVQKYNITFPVSELGNCNNLEECKAFCSDLANKDACIAFAKKHGFYNEQQAKARQESIMSAAQQELGCASEAACKEFCGQQQNWITCGDFARRHGLGPKKPEGSPNPEILAKAQEFLGCDSAESCKEFCSLSENHQKCEEFARMIKNQNRPAFPFPASMSGKPDGCTSAQCRAYCDRNPQECRQFTAGGKEHSVPDRVKCQNLAPRIGSSSASEKANFVKLCGPNMLPPASGSASISGRDRVCQEHPEKCTNFPPPRPDRPTTNSGPNNVQGVKKEYNSLETFLHWLGF